MRRSLVMLLLLLLLPLSGCWGFYEAGHFGVCQAESLLPYRTNCTADFKNGGCECTEDYQ